MPELKPEDIHAVCDTREQRPYNLEPFQVTRVGLKTGDYSLLGFEDKVTIERKSLDDLIGSISTGRERFEREVERLKFIDQKVILVEGSYEDIVQHRYLSRMHPNSVVGTIAKYQLQGLPIMLAGNRANAQDFAKRFLFLSYKYLVCQKTTATR